MNKLRVILCACQPPCPSCQKGGWGGPVIKSDLNVVSYNLQAASTHSAAVLEGPVIKSVPVPTVELEKFLFRI
jgi:hypothetical protein